MVAPIIGRFALAGLKRAAKSKTGRRVTKKVAKKASLKSRELTKTAKRLGRTIKARTGTSSKTALKGFAKARDAAKRKARKLR